MLDLWGVCASEDAMHPIVRARLADLLWTRRHRGPTLWFRVAVLAYLDLADTCAEVVERTEGLQRSEAICKEANQPDLLNRVLDAVTRLVQESLDRARDEPGIVIRGLHVLADNKYDCAALVTAATEVYGDDPWLASDLREVSIKLASGASERSALQSGRVGAFEAAADAADGLLRFAHLTKALEIAESDGLADDARRVRNKLENTDPLTDGQTIEVTQEIDLDEIKREVDKALGDGDLRDALLRYGTFLPVDDPEQSRQSNRRGAQRLSTAVAGHPLSCRTVRLRLSPAERPRVARRRRSGAARRDEHRIVRLRRGQPRDGRNTASLRTASRRHRRVHPERDHRSATR